MTDKKVKKYKDKCCEKYKEKGKTYCKRCPLLQYTPVIDIFK